MLTVTVESGQQKERPKTPQGDNHPDPVSPPYSLPPGPLSAPPPTPPTIAASAVTVREVSSQRPRRANGRSLGDRNPDFQVRFSFCSWLSPFSHCGDFTVMILTTSHIQMDLAPVSRDASPMPSSPAPAARFTIAHIPIVQ